MSRQPTPMIPQADWGGHIQDPKVQGPPPPPPQASIYPPNTYFMQDPNDPHHFIPVEMPQQRVPTPPRPLPRTPPPRQSLEEIIRAVNSPRTLSSRITLAKMPPSFDRTDKSKWDTWYEKLTTYTGAYRSEFDSEEKKIFFTLSLLGKEDGTPCPASNWARNWKRCAI